VKTKLQHLLGNPKQRKKWLKELADAQAVEKGMDLGKHLQHLQQTKEQHRIAWQIWYTNQTQW